MTTGDALLRAILANPEEDTPRLMYADYLDESGEASRGEASRAEFIRVQVELANLEGHFPAHGVPQKWCDDCLRLDILRARERELLADGNLVLAMWPPGVVLGPNATFRRGFVSEISLHLSAFTEDVARKVFASHPVEKVTLSNVSAHRAGSAWTTSWADETYLDSQHASLVQFLWLETDTCGESSATALDRCARSVAAWGRTLVAAG